MTEQALKGAFAGQNQAAEEGYPDVAKLLRAVSSAETRHTRNHLGIKGIGSTADNLDAPTGPTRRATAGPVGPSPAGNAAGRKWGER